MQTGIDLRIQIFEKGQLIRAEARLPFAATNAEHGLRRRLVPEREMHEIPPLIGAWLLRQATFVRLRILAGNLRKRVELDLWMRGQEGTRHGQTGGGHIARAARLANVMTRSARLVVVDAEHQTAGVMLKRALHDLQAALPKTVEIDGALKRVQPTATDDRHRISATL
jgi:hypothetical protein